MTKKIVGVCLVLFALSLFVFMKVRKTHHHFAIPVSLEQLKNKKHLVPIAIIGSGCAGYSAGVYGARSDMFTLIITGDEPGGQLAGTTQVDNWPGLLHELGPDIIDKVKYQAEHFGAQVLTDQVTDIDFSSWPYAITTANGNIMNALTIIIATGASPRLLDIPGESEYWGKGVTTCAICDAPFHKDKDVIVIGGGDSAAEEALQLAPYARTVTIMVRKDYMRASAAMQDRVKEVPNISIRYNMEVKEILGDNKEVTGVVLYNNQTKERVEKPVSGVFLAIGHIPNTDIVKNSLALDDLGYIVLKDRTQKTALPGVFAAGDVEDSKYRQAGVAAGSGIKAALDASDFLREIGFNDVVAQEYEPHYFEQQHFMKKPLLQIEREGQWQDLLKQDVPVFLDFYTKYCPSCLQMLPLIEELAYELGEKAIIVKIDSSQMPVIAKHYKVTTVPTLIALRDGKEVKRSQKAMSKTELEAFFKNIE